MTNAMIPMSTLLRYDILARPFDVHDLSSGADSFVTAFWTLDEFQARLKALTFGLPPSAFEARYPTTQEQEALVGLGTPYRVGDLSMWDPLP